MNKTEALMQHLSVRSRLVKAVNSERRLSEEIAYTWLGLDGIAVASPVHIMLFFCENAGKRHCTFCMKLIHVVLEVYLLVHRDLHFSHKADSNGAIFHLRDMGF